MTLKQAKELVRSRLSEQRYEHTLNVKKMAVKLAKRYGADEEQAALAALLHDAAKEISKDEMRAIMRAIMVLPVPGLPVNTRCRLISTVGRSCCLRIWYTVTRLIRSLTSAFTCSSPM